MQDLILLLLAIAVVSYVFVLIRNKDLKDEETNNVPNYMNKDNVPHMEHIDESEWGNYMNG